ncbi:MAG: tRNA pseudouridine(55) synthase TruB [Candidatus Liptonbacteria bacterium]|nr:tRNA pseudouridine(55) synthase TruB [Candidatus Liptonbacteria bacterium]
MENIFAIYKPKGPTSFDIIREFQKVLGKKIKIGHAGTLDPLASGVLVVAVGREATKKISEVVAKEKEYVADICLGATSTTGDAEGEKVANLVTRTPNPEEIQKILPEFIGKIMQTPPIYSALKIKGKTAYSLAREGKNVVMNPREVFVKEIEILSYEWPIFKIRVVTGPGVYIRALARDIGERLGTGGYLSGLERTRVGEFTKETCVSVEVAIKSLSSCVIPSLRGI